MHTKITKIDKAACGLIRDRINKELAEAVAKLGLTAKAGHASYDDHSVTIRVEVALAGFDKARHEFDAYCHMYGLTLRDYGSTFRRGNATYKIVGLNPNAPKYPIIAELPSGKRYRFTLDAIKTSDSWERNTELA